MLTKKNKNLTLTLDSLECLTTYNNLHLNYEDVFRIDLSTIDERFINNFKVHNTNYIGSIPTYTVYNIQELVKYTLHVDEDAIFPIIAVPGKGKSTISFINSIFLDKNFTVSNIIFTFKQFLNFISSCAKEIQQELETKQTSKLRGSILVLDEGVYMLFSADSNTKEGKLVTKLFSIIRYLNLIVFVNITNFSKIQKNIREDRFLSLLRIQEKGFIEFYSPKRTKQIEVDSNYNIHFPEPNFIEQIGYIDKTSKFWKEYNTLKAQFTIDEISNIQQLLKNAI